MDEYFAPCALRVYKLAVHAEIHLKKPTTALMPFG